MMLEQRKSRDLILLILAAWAGLGIYYSIQIIISNAHNLLPTNWLLVIRYNFIYFYIWFVFTPLSLRLGRRLNLDKPYRIKNILIHYFAGTGISLFNFALLSAISTYFSLRESAAPFTEKFLQNFQNLVASDLNFSIILYWGVIITGYAVNYYDAYQEQNLKAAQLETSLVQSKLGALKAQLNPHFLFNTLNTISGLVHEDSEAADKMIARLSGLLRISLETSALQEITLKQELNFVQKYLDIQQIRFAERLKVEMNIAPETYDALVPNMFLQPLVENAILYAVAPREAGGRIEIVTERKNGKLCVKIEDDGRNLVPNQSVSLEEGVGIKNTRERLERLYGDSQRMELAASTSGGLIVKIEIPFVESFKEVIGNEDKNRL